MKKVSTAEARNEFADIVNAAAFGKERVVLTRRGKKLAAIIPVEDLDLLEKIEDLLDLQDAKAVLKKSGQRIPYEKARKELGL